MFKDGESGNPSGRPKDKLGILIRENKDLPERLLTIALNMLKSRNEMTRLKVIEFLAERGFGKATQFIDMQGNQIILTIKNKDDKKV